MYTTSNENIPTRQRIGQYLLLVFCILASVGLQAQTANYSSGGSDYAVTASWSGIPSNCCEQSTTAKFYINSKFNRNGSGRSGSVSMAVGPASNHHYRWKWELSGKDKTVCVFSCSDDSNLSTGYRVSTSSIKYPGSVAASDDKVGSIKITWSKRTNIPNGD
ncbi:MAG: hypothetical protein AAF990_22085, partial [Bacteroidota bacterium]